MTGSVVRVGMNRGFFDDVYHFLMEASWLRLIAAIASVYLGTNGIFACLYLLGGDVISGAEKGSFPDAFFFSVQTLSTIGYGVMAPKGVYGSVLVTFEAFVGLMGVAMASGLMFSKFARPTSRILFANKLVISRRDGKPCLLLRMANERSNDVVEASLRVSVLKEEITAEGDKMRRFHDLKLMRSQQPLFTLSWLAVHVIDEHSALHGETAESIAAGAMRFVVSFTGLDGTFAQTIHARHMFFAEDVVWNARFVDVMSSLPDGRLQLDYSRFHDVELLPPAADAVPRAAA